MQVHFPTSLHLRVPHGLPKAVQQAAKQRHQTPAEWLRQTLLCGLEAEGVRLSDSESTDLSSLRNNDTNDGSHRT
jgi:hypothetical protein